MRLLALVTLCLPLQFVVATWTLAADPAEAWTRFRGPNGSGVFKESNVPIPWKENQVQWRIDLPGQGNGSPIIWQNRFYVMSADPDNATRYLIAGDLKTGKTIWKKQFASTTHVLHVLSSYASSTPCLDADRVYFTWGAPESVTVKAFSHAGEEIWTREFPNLTSQHGFGTSPMLVDGLLILTISHDVTGKQAASDNLIAMNAETGKTEWLTPRTSNISASYGVPCIKIESNGRKTLLTANTSDGFAAYDALTGEKLWSKSAFSLRVVSSAVLAGNLVLSTQGSGNGGNVLVAMKTDGYGQEAFRIVKSAPYVPTPVVLGEHAYLWDDKGIVTCVHLPDGETAWTRRIGGDMASSPIVVNDKLIGISQDGVITILSASNEFQKLGEIKLDAICRSTPAVDSEHLLIRTASQLICVGTGK